MITSIDGVTQVPGQQKGKSMISDWRYKRYRELLDAAGIDLQGPEGEIKKAAKKKIESKRNWAVYDFLEAENSEADRNQAFRKQTRKDFHDYFFSMAEALEELEGEVEGSEAEEALDHFLNLLVLLLKWDRHEERDRLETTLDALIRALE